MSDKRKSTESKSKDPVLKRIAVEAEQLEHTQREKWDKSNRKDNIFALVFTAFYLVMAVLAVIRGDWDNLLFILALYLWIPMMLISNRIINGQRFVINMMAGLRDIENDALMARVEEDMKTQPKGKK